MMTLYTIGFTRTTAEYFFGRLREAGVRVLVDVRLHNSSQLAGFAKRDDLAFFVRELLGGEYYHEPLLAPTEQLLSDYRARRLNWSGFAAAIGALLAERTVAEQLPRDLFSGPTALLCSEATAERCHRRIAAEHLAAVWSDISIVHL